MLSRTHVELALANLGLGALLLWASTVYGTPWIPTLAFFGIALVHAILAWRARNPRASAREKTLDRAAAMEEHDPIGAQQLVDSVYLAEEANERRLIAELQQRSLSDNAAAIELRRRLETHLAAARERREHWRQAISDDPRLPILLERLDREMADLEGTLKKLPHTAGSTERE